ncbi:unnamed protein product [Chrysodeixis includens]|uniref:Secreted protein n=1 Tax=Chrysodeixis includens TaxID=689277 RepID=A0A9N8KTV5_CHRIL|nr:unnamed protein product [Chrysodeixis includens]
MCACAWRLHVFTAALVLAAHLIKGRYVTARTCRAAPPASRAPAGSGLMPGVMSLNSDPNVGQISPECNSLCGSPPAPVGPLALTLRHCVFRWVDDKGGLLTVIITMTDEIDARRTRQH